MDKYQELIASSTHSVNGAQSNRQYRIRTECVGNSTFRMAGAHAKYVLKTITSTQLLSDSYSAPFLALLEPAWDVFQDPVSYLPLDSSLYQQQLVFDNFDEQQQDVCWAQIITSDCPNSVTSKCWHDNTQVPHKRRQHSGPVQPRDDSFHLLESGYILTHQLLYLLTAQRAHCLQDLIFKFAPSHEPSLQGSQSFLESQQLQICSILQGYIERVYRIHSSSDGALKLDDATTDFIVEASFVCLISGFRNFLNTSLIESTIEMQIKAGPLRGCVPETNSVPVRESLFLRRSGDFEVPSVDLDLNRLVERDGKRSELHRKVSPIHSLPFPVWDPTNRLSSGRRLSDDSSFRTRGLLVERYLNAEDSVESGGTKCLEHKTAVVTAYLAASMYYLLLDQWTTCFEDDKWLSDNHKLTYPTQITHFYMVTFCVILVLLVIPFCRKTLAQYFNLQVHRN